MAIKYYEVPEKRQVIAVLKNTKWDAYNKIDKLFSETNFVMVEPESAKRDRYLMPDEFKVVVTCDPRDEYSFEVGANIAKQRIMDKYYHSLDKRLNMFAREIADFAYNVTMSRVDELDKKRAKKI